MTRQIAAQGINRHKKEGFHLETLCVIYIQFFYFCIPARLPIPSGHASPIGSCRPPHLRVRPTPCIYTKTGSSGNASSYLQVCHDTTHIICFKTPRGYSVRYALAFVGALTGSSLRSCSDESDHSIAVADISKLPIANLKIIFRDSLCAPQSH